MSNQFFTVVRRGRRLRNVPSGLSEVEDLNNNCEIRGMTMSSLDPCSPEEARRSIDKWKIAASRSEYFQSVIKALPSTIEDVFCIGIGSVFISCVSQVQLGFLLAIEESYSNVINKNIFDPILTEEEKHFLKKNYNFNVLENNLKGKYPVDSTDALFYMPHCPRILYCNLLFENWNPSRLQHLCIIGNSFSRQQEMTYFLPKGRQRDCQMNDCVQKATFCLEENFDNRAYTPYPSAFSGTSVMSFPLNKLKELLTSFWIDITEPEPSNYSETIL